MPYCDNCGNKLESTDNFCPSCGIKSKRLAQARSERVSEKVIIKQPAHKVLVKTHRVRRKRNGTNGMGAAIAILFIAAMIFILYLVGKYVLYWI